MPVVICLASVVAGILVLLSLNRFFIAISRAVVNHDESVVPCPREEGLFMLFVTLLCFLVLLLFGWLLVRLFLLVLMMLLSGPALLVFWSSGFLFLVLCTGRISYVELLSV